MIDFTRLLFRKRQYPALGARWHLEEMRRKRSVEAEYFNIYRWARKCTPQLEPSLSERQETQGGQELSENLDKHQDQGPVEVFRPMPSTRRLSSTFSRKQFGNTVYQIRS